MSVAEKIKAQGTQTIELNKYSGTTGPDVLDVTSLYKQHGVFTYDPGFLSTASCPSAITYIDGDKGVLMYRGYPIEQLAEKSTHLETAYLLINGELPTKEQLAEFEANIYSHTMVNDQVNKFFYGFKRSAHPMAVLTGVVGALSAFYHDNLDASIAKDREIVGHRLIAKLPTIAAWAYKYTVGQPFVYPRNSLNYAENFLHMMFSTPAGDYEIKPEVSKAMDRIFMLHADHEQNASTSTVRLAGSSVANPYACIAAGIACLWGPSHGGANEAVLDMLEEIGSVENIPAYIEKVKDKENATRLMGFGHRVYKNFDPRAKIMKSSCDEVLKALDVKDPLLDIAKELEKIALEDPYFVERNLYPNVDFYSGIILKAIGIPTSMFTAIFALSRTVGWYTHWKEMIEDPALKIGRPRQLYIGEDKRDYAPINKRKAKK